MSWENVKLGGLIDILSGYAFDSKYFTLDAGKPLIRIRDIKRSFTETYFNSDYDNKFLIKKGDVLIGMDGEFNIAEWKGKDALLNQRVCKVSVKDTKQLDLRYLLHYLPFQLKLIEEKTSFVTVKHLSVKDIQNILIPLPPLETQKRIADILDAADALRQKDQELLRKYDELAQAIFIDMFGDPVKNEKGWEVKSIENLVSPQKHSIKRGPFGGALKKEIFIDKGYLVYEQFHALNNDFSFARYYINEDKYQELIAFDVKPKDIIISCSGVYLGKLAIVPDNAKPGIINQALLKLTLDETKYKNAFFVSVFTQENFKEKYFASERGAAIPNFPPMSTFKEFKFICPPIALQEKYLAKIYLIKHQKGLVKKTHSDKLFLSLLQKAFKGELI
jgi:type I restriction enzyme S subunit